MHEPKKKPERAGSGSRSQHSTPGNFPTPASIRHRFGTGWPGYEAAKAAWKTANPGAEPFKYAAAMHRIARAVGV